EATATGRVGTRDEGVDKSSPLLRARSVRRADGDQPKQARPVAEACRTELRADPTALAAANNKQRRYGRGEHRNDRCGLRLPSTGFPVDAHYGTDAAP